MDGRGQGNRLDDQGELMNAVLSFLPIFLLLGVIEVYHIYFHDHCTPERLTDNQLYELRDKLREELEKP